ncbi:hypothetical protein GSI_10562 [Ganoderma sinense ZZ0214-1]|uniref:Uncharacterized protein n=1 Tax=Ganoderma sinense ZZ0214-1 TaxID=1077348 RepID=A0A2G8S0Z9_9APHY|nr:hypothetical protein GSI_10562 [Ganoderma sinense ZZ0214-1]
MSATTVSPESFVDQCTVDIKVEPHDEHPQAMKFVIVHATHSDHGGVGSLTALKINRRQLRGDFIMVMDDESQELSDFATTLFDDMGHLKPEFMEHEHQKGSGVWGHELDSGVLLYILSVDVQQARTTQY